MIDTTLSDKFTGRRLLPTLLPLGTLIPRRPDPTRTSALHTEPEYISRR